MSTLTCEFCDADKSSSDVHRMATLVFTSQWLKCPVNNDCPTRPTGPSAVKGLPGCSLFTVVVSEASFRGGMVEDDTDSRFCEPLHCRNPQGCGSVGCTEDPETTSSLSTGSLPLLSG